MCIKYNVMYIFQIKGSSKIRIRNKTFQNFIQNTQGSGGKNMLILLIALLAFTFSFFLSNSDYCSHDFEIQPPGKVPVIK